MLALQPSVMIIHQMQDVRKKQAHMYGENKFAHQKIFINLNFYRSIDDFINQNKIKINTPDKK